MVCGIFLCVVILLYTFGSSSAISYRERKRSIDERQTLESRIRKSDIDSISEKLQNLQEKIANIAEEFDKTEEHKALPSIKEETNSTILFSKELGLLKENYFRLLQAFLDEKQRNINNQMLLHETSENLKELAETVNLKNRENSNDILENSKQIIADMVKTEHNKLIDKIDEMIRKEIIVLVKPFEIESLMNLRRENQSSSTEQYQEKGNNRYTSCKELLQEGGKSQSGIYTIYPHGLKYSMRVYCDQETDGGGWIVIQRRQDGSVDFYREWNDYKAGFGTLDGEFWLGNDHISYLTSNGNYDLRIDLVSWENNEKFDATYSGFRVGPETTNYTLTVAEFIGGNCRDALSHHSGMAFSTKDKDNDNVKGACARNYRGAWWYKRCLYSGLNGIYGRDVKVPGSGVYWYFLKNYYAKFSEMKIRQKMI